MTTLAEQFTSRWRPIITPVAAKYGIDPNFLLTQIAQESLWGTKTPKGSNNFSGIKDFRRSATGVMANDAGNLSKFRKFDSEAAFADHYANMLSRLYPGTVGAKNIQAFTSALQDGKRRYAEAPHYKRELERIYNAHYAGTNPVSSTTTIPSQVAPRQYNQRQAGDGAVDYLAATAPFAPPVPLSQTNKPATGVTDPYAAMWNIKPSQGGGFGDTKNTIVSGRSPFSPATKIDWGIR